MVDAPTEVSLKGVSEVIPISVLHELRMEFAKDVDEPPRYGLLISRAGVNMEIDIVCTLFRMVDIDGLGRDVQVTNPDGWFLRVQGDIKVGAHTSKPSKLQRELFRRDRVTLRRVAVDNRNTAD